MTRRIALALVALTAAVLVAAVLPLAFNATAHERDAFVNDTAATARSLAAIAEARLGDHATDPALSAALVSAARQGDELLVLNEAGNVVESRGVPRDAWRQLAAQAVDHGEPTTELTKDRAIAVQTVWNDGRLSGLPIGTVVLERPTGALNENIQNLWLYLALLAGGAMAAAVAIAIYFARWVSRPLARLDTAARQIADGELSIRAGTRTGPPEVRRMAATFNMMAGRLETLVHGHRAMLADASHQLRTPLTALRLRLDLLAADSTPAAADELAGAQEEVARLSRLVDGLLATARAESVTERVVPVNLIPAVAERVAAWQPVADAHGVKLVTEHAGEGDDRPRVSLGVGHLEQILDNLLDNAIEAIGDRGGCVTVTVASSGACATLTVADDGPGMPEPERSRAFLRFATGRQTGTGLGLAIVHRLVTSNGGSVRLASTQGGGLTVVLEFPGTAIYDGAGPALPKFRVKSGPRATAGPDCATTRPQCSPASSQQSANPNVSVKYLQSTTQSDYVTNINSFLASKCNIIVTVGFLMAQAAQRPRRRTPARSSRSWTTPTRRRSRTSTRCSSTPRRTASSAATWQRA